MHIVYSYLNHNQHFSALLRVLVPMLYSYPYQYKPHLIDAERYKFAKIAL